MRRADHSGVGSSGSHHEDFFETSDEDENLVGRRLHDRRGIFFGH